MKNISMKLAIAVLLLSAAIFGTITFSSKAKLSYAASVANSDIITSNNVSNTTDEIIGNIKSSEYLTLGASRKSAV